MHSVVVDIGSDGGARPCTRVLPGDGMTEDLVEDSAGAVLPVPAPAAAAAEPVRDERPPREKILDGAQEIFALHGYSGSSLRMIAAHVSVSHPGLLHHFPSKASLLDAVIDRLEARAQHALDALPEIRTDRESLSRWIEAVLDPAADANELLAVLDTEAVNPDFPGRFRISRLRRVYEHILVQCFERAAVGGGLREGVDADFAARAVLSMVLGHAVRERSVRPLQRRPHADDPRRDVHQLLDALLAEDDAEDDEG